MAFTHFHVHSQYSILDGAASVPGLVEKAIADGMTAISLTDHGNMFGIKLFYDTCRKKGIKPILGASDYPGQESEGVFEFGQALFDGVRGWVLLSSAY